MSGSTETEMIPTPQNPFPEDAVGADFMSGNPGGRTSCGARSGWESGCGVGCDTGCGVGCDEFFGPMCHGPWWYGNWWHDLSLFVGAHAFRGPVDNPSSDQLTNSSFGLHEGLNFGRPLPGPWEIGYQIGCNVAHSNFSGLRRNPDGSARQDRFTGRNQVFLTAGLFRRALCGGIQWGVVFDYQHDDYYYGQADLKQIRSEASLILPQGNEIGYFGAYGIGTESLISQATVFDPTDMYAVFYRRQFELGGEGRIWAGLSGEGDAVLGTDLRLPIGGGWSIENRCTYLIPRYNRSDPVQKAESWGLTIQLVWHPAQHAACLGGSKYRPLLNVADNATFIVDRHGPRTQ
jgi:hypothetical protein